MIPKIIFIVPYKNRVEHKYFFSQYLTHILKEKNYEIYFSNQLEEKPFNRGASKNIGFLACKQKYPQDYENITFVFHDIDTIPFQKIFDYETKEGIVKHFYGFDYALGGILSILGKDFEKINGYPNYWGWGMEDNILQKRCNQFELTIDRTHFYPIGSPCILHLFDGVSRIINKTETKKFSYDNGSDGIKSFRQLHFSIDLKSVKESDNEFHFEDPLIFIVNIKHFDIPSSSENNNFYHYDLREHPKKIMNPEEHNKLNQQKEWTDIPPVEMKAKKFVFPKDFKTKQITKNPPRLHPPRRNRITLGGII